MDTNLVNLKSFTLNLSERYFDCPGKESGISSVEPNHFNNMVDYKNKFSGYTGRAKVKFVHNILVYISPDFEKNIKEHCKNVQKGLPDFEYSYWVEKNERNYCLTRSMNVADNFEIDTKLRFIRRLQ